MMLNQELGELVENLDAGLIDIGWSWLPSLDMPPPRSSGCVRAQNYCGVT